MQHYQQSQLTAFEHEIMPANVPNNHGDVIRKLTLVLFGGKKVN